MGQGSGADYLYTYLRSYYRDDTKATGWNNLAFPSVGMPHVLWELQGQRNAKFVDQKDPHDPSKSVHVFAGYEQISPGTMTPVQFDETVADLVAFMNWMAEPEQNTRQRVGVWVLLFLGLFTLCRVAPERSLLERREVSSPRPAAPGPQRAVRRR